MKEITRFFMKGGFSMKYNDARGYSANQTTFDKIETGSAWAEFKAEAETVGIRVSHKSIQDIVIPWHKIEFYWEVEKESAPTAKSGAGAPKAAK